MNNMADLRMTNAVASNMTDNVEDWEVDALEVDSPRDQEETEYLNEMWPVYWGYFNSIPELKQAVLMAALWTVGKGYETEDSQTKVILEHIRGMGKDTFTNILFNMEVVKRVNGDAYAEIIKDKETGTIINLKPLNPAYMKIVVDRNGIIKRYEQINKTDSSKNARFKPEDIFHLSRNRLADQIHGISDIKAMEEIIKADQEHFFDTKTLMHHQARPMIMFKLATDNKSEIDAFVAKMDAAINKGENIYVPGNDNVEYEVVKADASPIVLEWSRMNTSRFYRALGLPLILFGSTDSTESGGKMEYAAHETVFKAQQEELESQIWNQLYLKISLISPTSLLDNLQTDQAKDANQGLVMQGNDINPQGAR